MEAAPTSHGPTACVPGLVPLHAPECAGLCAWEPVLLGSGSGPSHPLPSTLNPSGLPHDLTLPERGGVGGPAAHGQLHPDSNAHVSRAFGGVRPRSAGAASGAGGPWSDELELDQEEVCAQSGSPGSPAAPGVTSWSWTGEDSPGSPRPAQSPAAHAGCVWRAGEEAGRVALPRLLPAALRPVSPLAADRQAAGLSRADGPSVPQGTGSRPCRTSGLVSGPSGLWPPGSSSRPPSALCFPDSPPAPGPFRPAPCTHRLP